MQSNMSKIGDALHDNSFFQRHAQTEIIDAK